MTEKRIKKDLQDRGFIAFRHPDMGKTFIVAFRCRNDGIKSAGRYDSLEEAHEKLCRKTSRKQPSC